MKIITACLVGVFAGVVGAIIGALPIGILHHFLSDLLVEAYGSYGDTPAILLFLTSGLPIPFAGLICLPLGGGFFGLLGALAGLGFNRLAGPAGARRIWVPILWGGMAGFLFNLCISFWAQ